MCVWVCKDCLYVCACKDCQCVSAGCVACLLCRTVAYFCALPHSLLFSLSLPLSLVRLYTPCCLPAFMFKLVKMSTWHRFACNLNNGPICRRNIARNLFKVAYAHKRSARGTTERRTNRERTEKKAHAKRRTRRRRSIVRCLVCLAT